ncbi:MAG: maleylpyruvate isomerase family mycothiol-dependent enzyme [Nocardioidaceae bacterium]|nr:maleylpyruvate isomerase family mycothiol-dependent enzyme [Nocardioidaceae bacterium]
MDTLATYLAAWRETADQVLALCRGLTPTEWARPTDLPGWTVHDVVAHLADVETQLADGVLETGTTQREMAPAATRGGVEARRDVDPETLLDELAAAVDGRAAALAADPPTDPAAHPPGAPADLGWDWNTLLRNRVIDLWVHEQDIRRAVDAPGGMDSAAAEVTVATFASALPYVLGKKVAPPPGTVVGWAVEGPVPLEVVLRVGDDGRARVLDTAPGAEATWLRMDTETFTLLAAGRRAVDAVPLQVDGDHDLAARVAAEMAVTP